MDTIILTFNLSLRDKFFFAGEHINCTITNYTSTYHQDFLEVKIDGSCIKINKNHIMAIL